MLIVRIAEFFCFRTFLWAKSNFLQKGVQLGFEMAEKKLYKHTDRHFRIYISRDDCKCHIQGQIVFFFNVK